MTVPNPRDRQTPVGTPLFSHGASAVRTVTTVNSDYTEGKWPVLIRLIWIIGLSAGLWSAIIWGFVTAFG